MQVKRCNKLLSEDVSGSIQFISEEKLWGMQIRRRQTVVEDLTIFFFCKENKNK
jgi:hypothetical protein